MKLMTSRKVEETREERFTPVAEMDAYRAALAKQGEVNQKAEGLRVRHVELSGQLEELQENLADARARKATAIEHLALGTITRSAYDAIKTEIARILEAIEEATEQIAVIQRNLGGMSPAILKAGRDVLGARFGVLQAFIDHEAAAVRELVGAKVWELCCLAAQTNVPDYGAQLKKIFPDLPFDERRAETDQATKSLFGGE